MTAADWTDPVFVAAKRTRATAYAVFASVAAANPYRAFEPEWLDWWRVHVLPLRVAFEAASKQLLAETKRVIQEGER